MGLIHGVCPVLEVPFTERGSIDLFGFDRIIDYLIASGVTGAMFPGYASEFLKLSEDERAHLSERFLRRTSGAVGFMAVISIPDHGTRNAVIAARRASDSGAAAINVLPPYLLAPSGPSVAAHLRSIAAAVDPTSVIVQFAPAQTGSQLPISFFESMAQEHSNFRQVKVEAVPPGALISALASMSIPVSSLVGYAGLQLIDGLRRGAVGVQPGVSFVELYQKIWSSWQAGDKAQAQELHLRLMPYLSYWMQSVELIIAAEKRISMLRGLIESGACRAPGYALDTYELEQIDRFIAEFGDELSSL